MEIENGKVKITKTKLMLAEGRDAELFLVWACRKYYSGQDVQVMDFGGVNELPNFLKLLSSDESYAQVKSVVIARDAENNVKSAVESITSAMQQTGMPVPSKPFEYAQANSLRSAFMIFPGPNHKEGTLEDLCLLTVEDDNAMECVNDFFKCVKKRGESLPRCHKNRLHCFLSGKDKFVGSSIGQASYKGAWDPDHSALAPFKAIIEQI